MYPTTNNSNYFELLAQNNDDGVTVLRSNCRQDRNKNDDPTKNNVPLPPSIHNFWEATNSETVINASNIKIVVDMAVEDSGATGHFLLPGTKFSNMKISKKNLTINLPDGTPLKSTHTCEIDVPRLLKCSRRAHVVPGIIHTSLISIKLLTDAGCNVFYDTHEFRVYFRNKIVWAGFKESTTGLWVLLISTNSETSFQDGNNDDTMKVQLRTK